MKKYMRVVAVLIVCAFFGGVHTRVVDAAKAVRIERNYDPHKGIVSHTLVTYSDKNERYHGHLYTYVNDKVADYVHKIFTGSGYKYLYGGIVTCKAGDGIGVRGYVVK